MSGPGVGRVAIGRPREVASARRFVAVQRDRAALRLWRSAPSAVSYLSNVIAGRADFDEGKFKAAREILMRTMPTLSSQTVDSRSASFSATTFMETRAPAGAVTDAEAIAFIERRIEELKAGAAIVPSEDAHE